jgi:hypothetical protein
MKDIGWTLLKKESKFNFLKWGEYMKRAQIAEMKVEELTREIKTAVSLLREAKLKFYPNTTNSFVDDFIKKHEDTK